MGTNAYNPSVKVYIMDKVENLPLYSHTFSFDLDQKNQNPTFAWSRTQTTLPHAMKFGISSISPSSLKTLAESVLTTNNFAQNVYMKMIKDQTAICDDSCKQDM